MWIKKSEVWKIIETRLLRYLQRGKINKMSDLAFSAVNRYSPSYRNGFTAKLFYEATCLLNHSSKSRTYRKAITACFIILRTNPSLMKEIQFERISGLGEEPYIIYFIIDGESKGSYCPEIVGKLMEEIEENNYLIY